jgi:hypothetical protein
MSTEEVGAASPTTTSVPTAVAGLLGERRGHPRHHRRLLATGIDLISVGAIAVPRADIGLDIA